MADLTGAGGTAGATGTASAASTTGTAGVITYREAVAEGIARELRRDPSVGCLGEDIPAPGGGFQTPAGPPAESPKEPTPDPPTSQPPPLPLALRAALTH